MGDNKTVPQPKAARGRDGADDSPAPVNKKPKEEELPLSKYDFNSLSCTKGTKFSVHPRKGVVVSYSMKDPGRFEDDDIIPLTPEELGMAAAYRKRCEGVRLEAANGSRFTVQELFDNVAKAEEAQAEEETRSMTEEERKEMTLSIKEALEMEALMPNPDMDLSCLGGDHVYFEGLHNTSGDVWKYRFGS